MTMLIELFYLHRDLTGPESSKCVYSIDLVCLNQYVADLFSDGPLKSHASCGIRHAKLL